MAKIDMKTLMPAMIAVIAVAAAGVYVWQSKSSSNEEANSAEETRQTDTNGNERYANTYCFEFGHETTGQGYKINAHDLEYFSYEGTSYVLCEVEFTNTSDEAMDFDPSRSIRLYLDNEQARMVDPSTVREVIEPHLYLTNCTIQAGRRETGYLVWSYYKDFEIIEVCYDEYISFTGEIGDATQLAVPSTMFYDANGNLVDALTSSRTFWIVPGSNEYHWSDDSNSTQCDIDYATVTDKIYVEATPEQMREWGYTPCPNCLPELQAAFAIVEEVIPPEPEPTAPPVVYATDEEGNIIYETNEDGEQILDEEGNPIPVILTPEQPEG